MLDPKLLLLTCYSFLGLLSAVTCFHPMTTTTTTTGAPWRRNALIPIITKPSDKNEDTLHVPRQFSLYAQAADEDASSVMGTSSSSSSLSSSLSSAVRFLGRGRDAIVRPGVVLVAPPDEFHHFLRQAAVYIYAMGEDEDDVYVIRGAIIDHPTPFNIYEMMPEGAAALNGEEEDSSSPVAGFLKNLVYRGGERGDSVFMLHSDTTLADQNDQEMIGSSGIFEGGLNHALSTNYSIDPQKAKFFFSYMEFTEAELDEMLENREDESTQWASVEVPPNFVLNSDWGRGEAWARLRNAIREK